MRRKIYLYFGNDLVDLDDDSFILLNWRREDLESPAAVKNAWTQTVKLPATTVNAVVLGNYYRLDRISYGAGGGTRTQFVALKRTPFTIYHTDGTIIQSGYFKLEKVTAQSYEVVLYGGLGGFIYSLTYASNGTDKLSLADLSYCAAGGTPAAANTISIPMSAATVNSAWGAMRYGAPASGQIYDVLNFAPALNGTTYPFKFDTNKALLTQGAGLQKVPNINTHVQSGGHYYDPHPDDGGGYYPVLLEFGNKHDEWEVQDLRCYCQRPVIALRSLIDAIQRYAATVGYTLTFDSGWYNTSWEYLHKTWMTLPLLDRDKFNTVAKMAAVKLSDYLAGTASPGDYLLAFAKTFGMVFRTSPDGSSVQLLLRDNYYTGFGAPIDLTDRLDTGRELEVRPFRIGHRFYEFVPDKVEGTYASDYLARYGGKYGRQLINTGYDFDESASEVMQGVAFNGAADVRAASPGYEVVLGEQDALGQAQNYALKFAFFDTVKYTLWYIADPDDPTFDDTITVEPEPFVYQFEGYLNGTNNHFLDLTEFHDASGKCLDGSGVLLFYNGDTVPPFRRIGANLIWEALFKLTDDNFAAIEVLNGNVPCWDASTNTGVVINKIPSFRRWLYSGSTMILSQDFGNPLEKSARSNFTPDVGVYENFWRSYIEDRLDQDTTVVRAYVFLDGLGIPPGPDLLRHLYYFQGSQWVLNAVENYSLTTLGPTLCEFVRVKDISHYTSGQYQI